MLRHPQQRGTGVSSALQKASALLKGGGRPGGTGPGTRQAQSSANSDENDITSYLAGLAQRTSGQANGRATHNLATEGVRQAAEPGSAGSKFLKKKAVSAIPENRAQDKDVEHLQKGAPSISAQQASPQIVSSAAQDLQRRETGIAGSASNLSLSRDSDGGLGSGLGTALSAITASQHSPGVGGPGRRFLKQSQVQLPTSQPGVTHVPPRGQSTSLPMRSAGPRGTTSQRSGLDTSEEGMTTLMEGLATTSNSARTSEEFGPDGPPPHMMRPALSTDRSQKGSRAPQPLHVAGARTASELPTADAVARRPATAPVAATPAAAFRASSARLNASSGLRVPSSPEPESIADDEEDTSDGRGRAESPRPRETILSARSSSAPSETTTPRTVHRVRLLDMDDLAAAAASEIDSEPPALAPFVAPARGRSSSRDGGGPTATAIVPSSRPGPSAPSAGVRQSGADSPTTEEIASSVSTSSSDESVVRPAVSGKLKPRPDSASSRKSERQSPRWQQRQPQQRSEAATETYSEDFDDSAVSELRSAHARSSGSSASVRSGSRGRMAVVQRRQQQSRHRRHSSSSADRTVASGRSRRSTAAVPRKHDRSQNGSDEGSDRRRGRQGGSRATNSTGSDDDGRDGSTHGRSRTYSYGSETWHTATPSPRRQERLERRPHGRPSRTRSQSLSSLSSRTSSDAEELSRRSQHRVFQRSPRQRASRDASPSRSRSQPHRQQRQQHAATTTTKADVCLQTGLDLEEAILRCHWNSPGAAFAQFRHPASASAATAATAAAPGYPSSSTLLEMNGLGLPSVTALSDLLARQVALTRDFMETQKRLHQCLLTSLECSEYRYTTLEETKQYIIAHRKPRLTFDEALRLVKEDMSVQ